MPKIIAWLKNGDIPDWIICLSLAGGVAAVLAAIPFLQELVVPAFLPIMAAGCVLTFGLTLLGIGVYRGMQGTRRWLRKIHQPISYN